MKKYIILSLAGMLTFSSCEDLWEPAPENLKNVNQMYTEPSYALGILLNVYRNVPNGYDNSEYATDDAVTNQKGHWYSLMATGAWTNANNPMSNWNQTYFSLQNLNLFIENVDKVNWAADKEASVLFRKRLKGEAYGLRALQMYYALRAHSGFDINGKLLGVPIITKYLESTSDFNLPRSPFNECVQQIYNDLDSAETYLPVVYKNVTKLADVPEKYQSVVTVFETYNRVMGDYGRSLFNGLIARSIRTRTSLLAASPAFQDASNTATWAQAADNAATVIDYIGGVSGLDSKGHTFYTNTVEIDALKDGIDPKEIIWRETLSTDNIAQEQQNFPPSLFGNGYMNPTQNLVDAFPMLNGYPISDNNSGFDPANPYAGRDPRLALYIIYNGSKAGVTNEVIFTGSTSVKADGSDNPNAINKTLTSTRTGYYMKKRLRMDVNPNSSSRTGKTHYNPRIRYTEMFLAYAEAANEAWGPKGTGSHAYSAYDVIKAIRKRAGIGLTNGDAYLEAAANDQATMRELIRNERRLELCFEGFRFWDLRRWKANINETAKGMDVNETVYSPIDVEERTYESYMYYGPIPNSEILKYSNLEQNKGWE
jgi:hypothetical protein